MSKWRTNPNLQLLFGPFILGLRYRSVSTGPNDRLKNPVLRCSDEVKECLTVYRRSVFAENEGRAGAGKSQLVWVYWIFVGSSVRCEVRES